MKIAVLSSFTTSLFWFRIDMMKAFVNAGCEVLAIGDAPEEEWCERFLQIGVRYRSIPVSRNGTNPINDMKTLCALYKLLKEEKPDKIFSYQAKTVIYGGIAARMLGISEVYPLIAGVGSVFLGEGLKRKLIKWILCTEYRVGLKKAANIFFQNRDDLNMFTSNGIITEDRVVMINGSGVNLKKFTSAKLPEETSFLCISRLIKDKGVMEYLDASRKIRKLHSDVTCVLVGPFDTNPSAIKPDELQPYIDDGSVVYVGEQKDVYPYLINCTAYVLPSYHEGTPKTVLEAMASGRPVITTDAPGCRETVCNGVNGYLVQVKNVDAVVEAMEKIIADPQKTEEMANNARKIAEDRYDVNKINAAIMKTMGVEG
ncbi:MAG: glycosyltransferase family 4 protein [Oscillospiraceae bacterium]|nr:glycosyltransferase family 4 protein [Oscillospiraceae bacterium]